MLDFILAGFVLLVIALPVAFGVMVVTQATFERGCFTFIGALIGGAAGHELLGTWGPSLAGISLGPACLGALVMVVIVPILGFLPFLK